MNKATDKLTRQKRLMLARDDEVAFEALVARVAERLGTPLKLSHVLRACITLLHHAEPQILHRAENTRLNRPPNEKAEAVAEFERRLARMFLVSFKEAAKME